MLDRHLRAVPVTVLSGARQTGKSTLARSEGGSRRTVIDLDDLAVAGIVKRDPESLITGPLPTTIDEVQRAPELLHAIKRTVDRERVHGQFLLTGSANLLTASKVAESLAGRASYLTLWPMTRREQRGLGRAGLRGELIAAPDDAWPDLLATDETGPEDWWAWARRCGFPTPTLQLRRAKDQRIWLDGYIRTYLERDVRSLSNIASLPDFRRLMRAAALRAGQLVNQAELGRDIGMPQPTVHRHLNLLETSYMLLRLPAFATNRTSRLIKTPKLYWTDTAVALSLADDPTPQGAHLESLTLQDLLAWRDAQADRIDVCYWRASTDKELDFIAEAGDRLLPIEVKATARPGANDALALQTFRQEYGKRSRPELLLHTGAKTWWILSGVLPALWWRVV